METAIGVFASRDRAEHAIRELREHLPEDAIIFLTRSENEAERVSKEFGAVVGSIAGGATGLYAGIVAAILVPGLGPVFALGAGAAAVLGLAGAGGGMALGKTVARDATPVAVTPEENCSEDVTFFREVLKEGRSLIVVRTESKELAQQACDVLDRLGLSIQSAAPAKMQVATRHEDDVTVLTVSGRITLGEGNIVLREVVRGLIDKGSRKIVLNLGDVHYIDSSGVGELVKTHTTVRNEGGRLRLANLSRRVNDLLQMTRLVSVFDIDADEATAIRALSAGDLSKAVA